MTITRNAITKGTKVHDLQRNAVAEVTESVTATAPFARASHHYDFIAKISDAESDQFEGYAFRDEGITWQVMP